MTDTEATPNSASVSFMLDEESFAALRIQAKTNNRTVSGELRALVHASLKPNHVLNPSPWGQGYIQTQPYMAYGGSGVTYTGATNLNADSDARATTAEGDTSE